MQFIFKAQRGKWIEVNSGKEEDKPVPKDLNWAQSTFWSQQLQGLAVTMRSKKGADRVNQSKTYEVAPNHPFFNSLSHPPSPPLTLVNATGKGVHLDQALDPTSPFIILFLLALNWFFCRPPPAPVDAFGSQGSRRATYHNPYLVSSVKTIHIHIIVDIQAISSSFPNTQFGQFSWSHIISISLWISKPCHIAKLPITTLTWSVQLKPYHIHVGDIQTISYQKCSNTQFGQFI